MRYFWEFSIVFAVFTAILYYFGGFSKQEAIVLGLALSYIQLGIKEIYSQRKISLSIIPIFSNLFNHPDYPQQMGKQMLDILKKLDKGKIKRQGTLFNSYSLRFILDSDGSAVWSDYEATFSIAYSRRIFEGPDFPKRLVLLVEKMSKGLLPESEKEPLLVIKECHGKFQFSFVYDKGFGQEQEEKLICEFPSSILYNRFNLFPGKTLKKYGFEKEDDSWTSDLAFSNKYFSLGITYGRTKYED